MRIGKLRQRVSVQRPIRAQTDSGAEGPTDWQPVCETWAEVKPLTTRQRERLAGNQVLVDMDVTIRMRYMRALSSIDATWRIVCRGKVYSLLGVANVDELNEEFEAQCKIGTNDG